MNKPETTPPTYFHHIRDGTAVVPAVFMPEVLQVLVKADRRIRGVNNVLGAQLVIFQSVTVVVDPQTAVYLEASILARTHRRSFYDAAYLERAVRGGLPLATFDEALIRAAGAMQVPLVA